MFPNVVRWVVAPERFVYVFFGEGSAFRYRQDLTLPQAGYRMSCMVLSCLGAKSNRDVDGLFPLQLVNETAFSTFSAYSLKSVSKLCKKIILRTLFNFVSFTSYTRSTKYCLLSAGPAKKCQQQCSQAKPGTNRRTKCVSPTSGTAVDGLFVSTFHPQPVGREPLFS